MTSSSSCIFSSFSILRGVDKRREEDARGPKEVLGGPAATAAPAAAKGEEEEEEEGERERERERERKRGRAVATQTKQTQRESFKTFIQRKKKEKLIEGKQQKEDE